MVCDSLAVCQCFRTWTAFEVRMSRLVACVFGSTRRKQISGEFSPRSGRILSHLRSDTFLKMGPRLSLTSSQLFAHECGSTLVSRALGISKERVFFHGMTNMTGQQRFPI